MTANNIYKSRNTTVYLEIIYKKLKFNQKKNLATSCHSLFHTSGYYRTVLQNKQSRIHSLFICSLTFCWIRNTNSGSRSRQKFRIRRSGSASLLLCVGFVYSSKNLKTKDSVKTLDVIKMLYLVCEHI